MRTCVLVFVAALLALAGCGRVSADPGRPSPEPAPAPLAAGSDAPPAASSGERGSTAAHAAVTRSNCPAPGWDCAQLARFDAATQFIKEHPGRLSAVVRDRGTGAVWRAGATNDPMWTASTIKVAIAATLLERQRAGKIKMTGSDRSAMADMLKDSSNDAADTLWKRYDGPKMLDRFRTTYGMAGLSVVPGEAVYWRNLRCTAEDLDRLMDYALGDKLHADDRAYLVNALRGVADNQRWGVWAAGEKQQPGNKDGWAMKPDTGGEHWVSHTVGFAGPEERYVVTVMYSLPPGVPLDQGVQTVSDVVAMVFGVQTPVHVSSPST
jgi:hypothetical protein